MTASQIDLACARWRTASKDADTCVEVASIPEMIAVRDSKTPQGAVLLFSPGQWRAFTETVKHA